MSGLSDGERECLLADDLALSNLHADWGQEVLFAAVDEIVQAHLAAFKAEAVAVIEAEAHRLDPGDDWPEGGFEVAINAAGVQRAADIVRNLDP